MNPWVKAALWVVGLIGLFTVVIPFVATLLFFHDVVELGTSLGK